MSALAHRRTYEVLFKTSEEIVSRIKAGLKIYGARAGGAGPESRIDSDYYEEQVAEYAGLYLNYVLSTASASSGLEDPDRRDRAIEALSGVYAKNDFYLELDSIMEKIRPAPASIDLPRAKRAEVSRLFAQLDSIHRPVAAVDMVSYDICEDCNKRMTLDSNRSELNCQGCGTLRELPGMIFDEIQFYSQEGQKAKSGSFSQNRHCRKHVTHILAMESDAEIGDRKNPADSSGEKLLESLHELVRRRSKLLRLLTVYDTRELLRDVGRSDLNINVPLIMKRLTGVGPPCIGGETFNKAIVYVTQAVEIGETIRPSTRSNSNYYAYYFYKVFDCLCPELPERRVLYYIYLQGEDTLRRDDEMWKQIVEGLQELGCHEMVFKPTYRKEAAEKYRPA